MNKKLGISIFLNIMLVLAVFTFLYPRGTTSNFHTEAWITRTDGSVEYLGYHAGVLTTTGKNFIEGVLGNDAFANATHYGQFLCLSNSSSTPSAAWINIPGEIATGNLTKAEATYASTGNGVWTLVREWTATAVNAGVQLIGVCWDSGASDGSLLWSDTFTVVNMGIGDKLTVTCTSTVS